MRCSERSSGITNIFTGNFTSAVSHKPCAWAIGRASESRARSNPIELYDLKSDPGEKTNVAAQNPRDGDEDRSNHAVGASGIEDLSDHRAKIVASLWI